MKVLITYTNKQYDHMFKSNGWELTNHLDEADLIQFTGGSDVDPSLYGQVRHFKTQPNTTRDTHEVNLYNLARSKGKAIAGICRGGQLLNVLNGGMMYQDVDNHAFIGSHLIKTLDGRLIEATSTHHQMMEAGPGGEILATAEESSFKEFYDHNGNLVKLVRGLDYSEDPEVILYKESKSLCFQPHPEYLSKNSTLQGYYFELLEDLCST